METETLRPEFQNIACHADPTRQRQVLETPARQLKQEPALNPPPPSSAAQPPHPRPAAAQLPSPGSDDPTTQVGYVSESLQDPKPSSASTDPAPRPETPNLQNLKKLPPTSTPAPAPPPSAPIPPQVDLVEPPTPHTTLLSPPTSPRPFPFPHEDGFSSDEDEDFCTNYRTLLRRKSDEEMAAPTPPTPVVEQPKKQRNTRQSNSRGQRRRTREAQREIPFSDPKYHKMVGSMVLPPTEVARDLATIYGREYKETRVDKGSPAVRSNARKRQRGSETPNGNSPSNSRKRARQTNGHSADGGDKNAVAEVGRSTRYGKRSNGHVQGSGSERGYQGSHKRQKTGGCSAGSGENEQKKMFEKHPDKKGWVVCKKCESAVWPPNCGKHLFHCRKV